MSGMAGLRLAVGLLTIIPVRPPEQIGRSEARTAMLLAPLAVLPVALAAALLGWGAGLLGLPTLLAGTLAVALIAVGTRAMHLDGLADTTDGLGSGKDAAAALAIMRRGDIGPMGTVALVLVLITQVLAAAAILDRPLGWVQLTVLLCYSRAALAVGCLAAVPSARAEGLGALVAGSVPAWAAGLAWGAGFALAGAAGLLAGQAWWWACTGPVLAALACGWLLARCVRRLGGITGDVLGALVEVAATVLVLAAAVS